MATEKQIEANRRNAQKSTGPKTEAGKDQSRRNRITHGLACHGILYAPMLDEDMQHFHTMRGDLMKSWAPVGMKESQLVEMLAGAYGRMQRCERIEAAYMNGAMMTQQLKRGVEPQDMKFDDLGAGVVLGYEKYHLTFETLDRYRRNAWLDYDRTVRRLEAMQKQRRQQELDEKEEQLREARREEQLNKIRERSVAQPVVYEREDSTSEKLASIRQKTPNVFIVPFGHELRRDKRGNLTSVPLPIVGTDDEPAPKMDQNPQAA